MNNRIEKIKQHVKDHKVAYSCGTIAVVITAVGATGITYAIMRDSRLISPSTGGTAQRTIGVLGKRVTIKDSTLNTVSFISANRPGPPSWVVRCIETGVVFSSQHKAALEMGLREDHLSNHLNGVRDHVNGYTFERICMAA